MKKIYQIGIIALLMLTAMAVKAQDSLELETCNAAIRGVVVDKNTGLPLTFAIVELLNFSPRRLVGVTTDGEFVLTCVPVGRQRIRIAAANYNEQMEANILVTTGKEIVLRIELDEKVVDLRANAPVMADVLRPEMLISNNLKINNPFVLQGGRMFNIEEVTRYAGSLADPARFAANFTGVYNNNDNQNYIIARGNTPMGVGFRIEGVPLENPNHFAALGNTGANFPILNTNCLERSDFFNGNFSAEYGNATSAMFDMHIRNGNNKKFEFTGQFSLLGAEAMAEGPLKKGKSSFLIAARYGILGLMQALNLPITTGASPQYQDLTFKLHFPSVKRGDVSIFGIGSLSKVKFLDAEIDSNDVYAERGKDLYITATLGMAGINHKKMMKGGRTYLSTTLSQSWQQFVSLRDSVLPTGARIDSIYTVNERRAITTLGSFVNSKMTLKGEKRHTIISFRSGLRANVYLMDFKDKANYPVVRYEYYGDKQLQVHSEAYAQALFKFSEKLSLYTGVYANHFTINKKSWSVEPRLALHWSPKTNHLISLGYSWHSRLVPFIISYNVSNNPDGTQNTNNLNLGLFKSQHLSLSHRWQFSPTWQLQTNVYAQYLYNMPISTAINSFSYINHGDFPVFPLRTDLVSRGVGYNAGVELTVIRSFTNGFYATFSGTYSTSKYKGSDDIWRSTVYDIRYLGQAVVGREFVFGRLRNNFWTVDLRGNYHRGKPYTPIDTAASRLAGREILLTDMANTVRLRTYFRFDIKTGLRFNRRGLTHYVGLDLINVLGRNNAAQVRYNPELGRVVELSQFGFVPNIIYQVQF
jgi:hypothetical protein